MQNTDRSFRTRLSGSLPVQNLGYITQYGSQSGTQYGYSADNVAIVRSIVQIN